MVFSGRMTKQSLHARLVVDRAADALDFYTQVLGGVELVRYAEPSGTIVHAEVELGSTIFSVTEADGGLNESPDNLGGSPVLMTLVVPEADALGEAMITAGSEVIIPIANQFYGRREGRLRDPFGHLWIVSQDAEDLPSEEIQARLDGAG